jgi:predicted lipoprotein with Yx(FWY)xxD motif
VEVIPTTSATPEVASEAPVDEAGPRAWTSERLALLVFVAVEVAALITVLVLGRHQWFTLDEWDFLAGRNAGSITDLFRPHNEHWSTIPILVYRALFHLFGLRTYLPYQLIVVLLDLTAAALLRTVMRRAGVSPWVATAAASLFVLFGAGFQDMIWAFQIGFVGSLVLGLTHMLLADHDGPIDRRDYLGLLAGLAGLMCSAIAIPMTIAVGLATLLRRGWGVALLHTLPLAACYAIWWFGIGRSYYHPHGIPGGLSGLARFVWLGIRSSFESMGQLPGAGIALGALLVIGLWVAWARADWRMLRTRAAVPGALLLGGIAFYVIAATGQGAFDFGTGFASRSRYLQIFTAMALPAIAVAADALARRWRFLLPVALVLLVLGIPGNLWDLAHTTGIWSPTTQAEYRHAVLTLPNVPVANEVPRSIRTADLKNLFTPAPPPQDVTLGWLLDQKAAGRLPSPGPLDPRWAADASMSLAIQQSNPPLGFGAAGTPGPSPASPGSQSTSGSPGVSTPSTPLVSIAKNTKDGPILVDSRGMTLYTLASGIRPVPCTGSCGATWHALLAPPGRAALTGGPGVNGLGRSSSGTVVTYWSYPLFAYSGDAAPGQTNGDHIKSFGGTWHVIKVGLPKSCNTLLSPSNRVLETGDTILIKSGSLGIIDRTGRAESDEMIFNSADGGLLTVLAGPLMVQLLPAGNTTNLCL